VKATKSLLVQFRGLSSRIAFAFILCILYVQGYAQVASPYSRYGLGYVNSAVFGANKGMGDLAAPYASAVNINFANPASYATLTRTTIEIGARVEGVSMVSPDSTYHGGSGNLSHFALAFVPNAKRNAWAISVGLLPFTQINYNFIQSFSDSTTGGYSQAFIGKGSLYQAYVGGAYKVKGFSVGANIGYIFGKLEYQKLLGFYDTLQSLSTRNITDVNINSFYYNIGVQYQKQIYKNIDNPDPRKEIYMTVGAYGSGGAKMNAKISNYWDRFTFNSSGSLVVVDTLQSTFNTKGKITLPFNLGAGIMFGNELYWLIGADFKYMNWKSYSTPLDNGGLSNSWRVSVGGQITPKYDDHSYISRMQYRAGAYFGKSEVTVGGYSLNEAAGTLGFGFPLKKTPPYKEIGTINLTADFGSRGSADKSAIRENFYRFTLGFVLNDIWFIKRKFD
jgi:hypothetical protein